MLSLRTIELRPGTPGLPQTLITRENLIDCGQIDQLLAQAQAQADELLNNAQSASEALLKEARKQFWWPQPETQQPRMYLNPEMIGTRCPAKARKDWPADQTCMWRVE